MYKTPSPFANPVTYVCHDKLLCPSVVESFLRAPVGRYRHIATLLCVFIATYILNWHSDIATSIRLQKHTDILTVYKEYGMIMEEPLVNETDIS